MKKTFKIVTLGCRTNQYEAQAFSDQLKTMGYIPSEKEADLCIVNTCTVTESADSSSRHAIRQLKRDNPNAKVVVTGCYAERKPNEVLAAGAELVVPNTQKESLLKLALPDEEEVPEFKINQFEAHTRAFVKVQDGCNSFCTYCIIPYVRGRSRSRKRDEIIAEVKDLVQNGFKEIVLTGINIGDYDGGGDDNLAGLVKAVDQTPGLERLRISSIDPDEVNDELMHAVLEGRTTCPSFHIVLQSGSNQVLKRMNRKYTRQMFMQTVDKMRMASPDFTFTTDIIVGFPGETEVDFEETLAVMREVKFAKVHMFPYSKRPRTRAALFTDTVDPETIKLRKNTLLRLSEELSYQLRDPYVGKTMKVLTETGKTGHTSNFIPVIFNEEMIPNQILDVTFKSNTPEGLLSA